MPVPPVPQELEARLRQSYAAFNARDVNTVLTLLHPDIDWPNGMEGGRIHGHAAVRAYWARQWDMIDPHVEPQSFAREPDGRVAIDVRQIVRDHAGTILVDQIVQHV